MTVSNLPEGEGTNRTAFTPSDTRANNKVARRKKKVSTATAAPVAPAVATPPVATTAPELTTLPTGSRPVTRQEALDAADAMLAMKDKSPLALLADNGLDNLRDAIEAIYDELRATERAADRFLSASTKMTVEEAEIGGIDALPLGDRAADAMQDSLHLRTFQMLPKLGKFARYDNLELLVPLVFGEKPIKRLRRRNYAYAVGSEEAIRGDMEQALRIARVYLFARQGSAGRMLLQAVAKMIHHHAVAERFGEDGE